MRLLHCRSMQIELLNTPPERYAIVSHRWGNESEEVLFTDVGDPARAKIKSKGYHKVQGSCTQAIQDGLDYVWLDTCCIDRTNSVELQEAINAMYNWYRQSTVCYAYLHDVSDPHAFIQSDWFSRGWTLQELLAPKVLNFYTKDWRLIGTRGELIAPIAERTGINQDILRTGTIPAGVSISQKMLWMAKRETTKVEDRSYSMLGILGISMHPLYGIGDDAFEDLQCRLILKRSDQTLFAWYHTFIPPEDVVMADANKALVPVPNPAPGPVSAAIPANKPPAVSAPPPAPTRATQTTSGSAPNPTPVSNDDDSNTPPLNMTGFLATSPTHFLKAYEISEHVFRKHYVDPIRDYGYGSQFTYGNNLIRISVPMKHIAGKLWQAALRCSFDPPDGDQIQRPLVIYLKEIQSTRQYTRVHIAPKATGDGETPTQGVSGSLERLEDADLSKQGWILRDIHVIGRLGHSTDEAHPPHDRPSDPHALRLPTEAERVAQLPRHPPGIKTINILVCGEPGVASGRVVNFMLGYTVLKPLTDYARETMAATVIDATLRSKQVRILYVLGPRDPYVERKHYARTLGHMRALVALVREAGGLHLMVMCMVGCRPTPTVESNYRLFYETVCRGQVPMTLVVTGLGKSRRMEDWWEQHQDDPVLQQIARCLAGHKCITVLQGEDANDGQIERYKASKEMMAQFLRDFIARFDAGAPAETVPKAYCPEDAWQWYVSLARRATDLLLDGQRKLLEREGVTRIFLDDVGLSPSEAQDVVRQLFDELAMEL